MKIRIVSDSTCDLPQGLVDEFGITLIPMYIHSGSRTYQDGVDLSRREFYDLLPQMKPAATTAAPGPEVFRQVYEKLAAEGAEEILSIHISTHLSAVMKIAAQAARETAAAAVTALDSRQLSLGTGFQVLTAAQAAREGKSMAEILALLEDQVQRTHVFAALDTLEFLRRSGRMNFAVSFIGNLLKVKPFLKMHAGVSSVERIRTHGGAMRRLLDLLQEAAPLEKVALLHANASGWAEELLAKAGPFLPPGEVMVEQINPALGAHLGPGVVGFACVSAKR